MARISLKVNGKTRAGVRRKHRQGPLLPFGSIGGRLQAFAGALILTQMTPR
jgi:hypothetical protein